jgi:hypothetical protein
MPRAASRVDNVWLACQARSFALSGRGEDLKGDLEPAAHLLYARPTKGMVVAMTVMFSTLASSGRLAM